MKNSLRKLLEPEFVKKLPSKIKYRLNRIYHEKVVFNLYSKEEVFTSIWRNNYWGDGESLSGPGSSMGQTANLQKMLPMMFREYDIQSVFDAPCGDMNWMKHLLENADYKYLGGDIVGGLIEKNREKYAKPGIDFVKFDITADSFPEANVWLCRAVLFHLSNKDIYNALEKFAESNIKYMLTTNCVTNSNHCNSDIATGDWRLLDLTLPPFNFPNKPIWEIDDCADPHPPMTLALWRREQILEVLPNLRKMYSK